MSDVTFIPSGIFALPSGALMNDNSIITKHSTISECSPWIRSTAAFNVPPVANKSSTTKTRCFFSNASF